MNGPLIVLSDIVKLISVIWGFSTSSLKDRASLVPGFSSLSTEPAFSNARGRDERGAHIY